MFTVIVKQQGQAEKCFRGISNIVRDKFERQLETSKFCELSANGETTLFNVALIELVKVTTN